MLLRSLLPLLLIIFSAPVSQAMQIPVGFAVSFFDGMSSMKNKIPLLQKNIDWVMAKNLYDTHVIRNLECGQERIPKIIHQIWLGSPLPEKYKKFQQTWIDNHPDWEYKLWTDKDVQELGLINRAMYDKAKNYGVKSDIARYEILYRFGGLYVDTDFECLRPFDIFHHCFDFYTGMAYYTKFRAYNGLIACRPFHPILQYCIEKLNIDKHVHNKPAINILETSGPGHFSVALKRHMKKCTDACVAFPVGYFYPWPYMYRDYNAPEQIKRWIRPESFAIHHWHVSWNGGKVPGKRRSRKK